MFFRSVCSTFIGLINHEIRLRFGKSKKNTGFICFFTQLALILCLRRSHLGRLHLGKIKKNTLFFVFSLGLLYLYWY